MVGGSPGSRMLAIPNIGLAPLFAAVLLQSARAFADAARIEAIAGRALTILFAFSTLVLGPAQLLFGVNMHRTMAENTMFAALNMPARALRADTRLVMIASSDPMAYMYTRNVLGALGHTQASCWSLLSGAHADHQVTRTGARELTVEPVGSSMLQGEFERMYRAPWLPFQVGQTVEQCGLQIRVAALEEGRPKKIQVMFDRELDDPSLTLVEWQTDRFVPFVPPAIGKRALLKWTPGPTGLF
jgi:hypothetical protein